MDIRQFFGKRPASSAIGKAAQKAEDDKITKKKRRSRLLSDSDDEADFQTPPKRKQKQKIFVDDDEEEEEKSRPKTRATPKKKPTSRIAVTAAEFFESSQKGKTASFKGSQSKAKAPSQTSTTPQTQKESPKKPSLSSAKKERAAVSPAPKPSPTPKRLLKKTTKAKDKKASQMSSPVVKRESPRKRERARTPPPVKSKLPTSKPPMRKSLSTPASRAGYQSFMNRDGPMALGSKQLPEAAENCLEGLSFVVTGVLESFERDEITDCIKKYGGKVSQQVGKKTSYCVIGRDAGPKKLENVEKFHIKALDEDEFLDLVGSLPSKLSRYAGKSPPPKKKEKMESPSSASASVPSTPTLGPPSGSADQWDDMLWVDKYKPRSTKEIIGQQGERSNVKKLTNWIQRWNSVHVLKTRRGSKEDGSMFKAVLLSGPPGVGKTTSASLVCKEAGYSFIEFNASVTRSKKTLEGELMNALGTHDIGNLFRGDHSGEKQAVIMDEVDGMSGTEDRGGIQELISLIKSSSIPLICICNDRQHPKIRSLANHCYDLRFQRPRVGQIKGAMMKIAFREKVNIKAPAIELIATAANGDIRQTLHHLAMWSASGKSVSFEDAKGEAQKSKKQLKVTPFEACRLVFSSQTQKKSVSEQADLFFQDYSLMPLFAWENYPQVKPVKARDNPKKALALLSRAADSFSYGDIIEKSIHRKQAWDLLPVQAMFSSVIPGYFAEGPLQQMINFPQWLGRNSKQTRLRRIWHELAVHVQQKANVTSGALNNDYLELLNQKLTYPLIKEGLGGVDSALAVMESYFLTREDVDSINELVSFPGKTDLFSRIETKVKSAFTRAFNKSSFVLPYSMSSALPRKVRFKESAEGLESEDDAVEDESAGNDLGKDGMIRVKGRGRGTSATRKGRAKTGRGRGRGKKSL
eukprot:m.52473 g.52473  ORF g.52473 m.52473 type:complete len:919 (+) comp34211_c0_seq2:32-2788(+)